MNKKLFTMLMAGTMLVSVCGCTQNKKEEKSTAAKEETTKETEETKQLDGMTEDALHNITREEMIEKTGIDLPAPEGALDITYCVLRVSSETPVAEMTFTLEGKEAYLRAQLSSLIPETMDESSSYDEMEKSIDPAQYNISGLYDEWKKMKTDKVSYCTAYCYVGDESGFVAWVDLAPGILYNLGMEKDADEESLIDLANTVFSPVQGETDGE